MNLAWLLAWLCLTVVSQLGLAVSGQNVERNGNGFSDRQRIELLRYLQREQTAVLTSQANILQKLRSLKIAVGLEEGSLRSEADADAEDISKRVAISTEENPIECRITLDKAPAGSVCVAPCACSGSQKWVQLSILNKLRRKDPKAWVTCPTCRTSFRYDLLFRSSGVKASLIGQSLDNKVVVRVAAIIVSAVLAEVLGVYSQVGRFLVSRTFWQLYPHWSRITNLPFLLKFWFGKSAIEYLLQKYATFEKNYIVDFFANLETKAVQESLRNQLEENDNNNINSNDSKNDDVD